MIVLNKFLDVYLLLILDIDAGGLRIFEAATLHVDELAVGRIVHQDVVDACAAGRHFCFSLDVLRLIPTDVVGSDDAQTILRA